MKKRRLTEGQSSITAAAYAVIIKSSQIIIINNDLTLFKIKVTSAPLTQIMKKKKDNTRRRKNRNDEGKQIQ